MGRWFKGNTHIHSARSDGGKTCPELAEMYAAQGYDFLFFTDHWATSDLRLLGGSPPLLGLDGIELDGPDRTGSSFHVVALGKFDGLARDMGLEAVMRAVRDQGGLLICAHPYWTGNTLDDVLRHGFDGVEVYNHVCHWLNGKSEGGIHWDAMLLRNANVLGFAADDAHISADHPGWNGAWIMVNAPERTPNAILRAIRSGNFYSTRGPEFQAIERRDGKLFLHTSPVKFVRLVGPNSSGWRIGSSSGPLATETTADLPADWLYVRVEVEDDAGRRAWTNTLFVAE
jgi:hypothetical protein